MAIPKSPPRRYSSSRQMIAGDDINNLSDRTCSFQQVVPAGATQAAAPIMDGSNIELLPAAAAGVRLPVSYPGAEVCVLNNSGNAQTVYGGGTDVIQTTATTYAATATGVSLASLASVIYFCIKAGFWQRAATA